MNKMSMENAAETPIPLSAIAPIAALLAPLTPLVTTNLCPQEGSSLDAKDTTSTKVKVSTPKAIRDTSRNSDSGKSSSCSPTLLDCSFDSGIAGVLLDANDMQRHKRIQQCQRILLALERDREHFCAIRSRLSKISDRKKKKIVETDYLCNVCCAEIDPENAKTFVKCFICQKYICRSIKCADWLAKTAQWECELCQTSKESLAQTSSWVADQLSFNQQKLVYPMRARSEIFIPISECNDSSIHFESVSQIGANAALITAEQRLKIREYVEEIVSHLLGGNLDTISVNQLSKSENYLPAPKTNGHHLPNGSIVSRHDNGGISAAALNSRESTPGPDFTDVSEARLRNMIQKIIAETVNMAPLTKSYAVSEIALDRPSKLTENMGYTTNGLRHRTEHYFEPTIYQDLLATAVLNKIVDKQSNNNNRNMSESSPDLTRRVEVEGDLGDGGSTSLDQNYNIENQSITSGSSVEPRSECSYTDTEPIVATNDDKSSEFVLDAGRDSALSDYIAAHMVPLPNLESEEDDYMSVTSSAVGDSTWENNWLFKKKKSTVSGSLGGSSVGMLVPDPKEDVRAQIGDKTADEISDLSELGSDTDDSSLDLLRSNVDPINDRLFNKHLIGGQNSKLVLDELIERSSMISNTLPTEHEQLYTETRNDNVDAPNRTEAINSSVNQQTNNNNNNNEEDQKNLEAIMPPVGFDDSSSNPLTAGDAFDSDSEGCVGFGQVEVLEPTTRTPSVIEILAAIALGPMIAIPAADEPAPLTANELNTLNELRDLALTEIKTRSLELTSHSLGVIPEEVGELDLTNILTPDEMEEEELSFQDSVKVVADVEVTGVNSQPADAAQEEITELKCVEPVVETEPELGKGVSQEDKLEIAVGQHILSETSVTPPTEQESTTATSEDDAIITKMGVTDVVASPDETSSCQHNVTSNVESAASSESTAPGVTVQLNDVEPVEEDTAEMGIPDVAPISHEVVDQAPYERVQDKSADIPEESIESSGRQQNISSEAATEENSVSVQPEQDSIVAFSAIATSVDISQGTTISHQKTPAVNSDLETADSPAETETPESTVAVEQSGQPAPELHVPDETTTAKTISTATQRTSDSEIHQESGLYTEVSEEVASADVAAKAMQPTADDTNINISMINVGIDICERQESDATGILDKPIGQEQEPVPAPTAIITAEISKSLKEIVVPNQAAETSIGTTSETVSTIDLSPQRTSEVVSTIDSYPETTSEMLSRTDLCPANTSVTASTTDPSSEIKSETLKTPVPESVAAEVTTVGISLENADKEQTEQKTQEEETKFDATELSTTLAPSVPIEPLQPEPTEGPISVIVAPITTTVEPESKEDETTTTPSLSVVAIQTSVNENMSATEQDPIPSLEEIVIAVVSTETVNEVQTDAPGALPELTTVQTQEESADASMISETIHAPLSIDVPNDVTLELQPPIDGDSTVDFTPPPQLTNDTVPITVEPHLQSKAMDTVLSSVVLTETILEITKQINKPSEQIPEPGSVPEPSDSTEICIESIVSPPEDLPTTVIDTCVDTSLKPVDEPTTPPQPETNSEYPPESFAENGETFEPRETISIPSPDLSNVVIDKVDTVSTNDATAPTQDAMVINKSSGDFPIQAPEVNIEFLPPPPPDNFEDSLLTAMEDTEAIPPPPLQCIGDSISLSVTEDIETLPPPPLQCIGDSILLSAETTTEDIEALPPPPLQYTEDSILISAKIAEPILSSVELSVNGIEVIPPPPGDVSIGGRATSPDPTLKSSDESPLQADNVNFGPPSGETTNYDIVPLDPSLVEILGKTKSCSEIAEIMATPVIEPISPTSAESAVISTQILPQSENTPLETSPPSGELSFSDKATVPLSPVEQSLEVIESTTDKSESSVDSLIQAENVSVIIPQPVAENSSNSVPTTEAIPPALNAPQETPTNENVIESVTPANSSVQVTEILEGVIIKPIPPPSATTNEQTQADSNTESVISEALSETSQDKPSELGSALCTNTEQIQSPTLNASADSPLLDTELVTDVTRASPVGLPTIVEASEADKVETNSAAIGNIGKVQKPTMSLEESVSIQETQESLKIDAEVTEVQNTKSTDISEPSTKIVAEVSETQLIKPDVSMELLSPEISTVCGDTSSKDETSLDVHASTQGILLSEITPKTELCSSEASLKPETAQDGKTQSITGPLPGPTEDSEELSQKTEISLDSVKAQQEVSTPLQNVDTVVMQIQSVFSEAKQISSENPYGSAEPASLPAEESANPIYDNTKATHASPEEDESEAESIFLTPPQIFSSMPENLEALSVLDDLETKLTAEQMTQFIESDTNTAVQQILVVSFHYDPALETEVVPVSEPVLNLTEELVKPELVNEQTKPMVGPAVDTELLEVEASAPYIDVVKPEDSTVEVTPAVEPITQRSIERIKTEIGINSGGSTSNKTSTESEENGLALKIVASSSVPETDTTKEPVLSQNIAISSEACAIAQSELSSTSIVVDALLSCAAIATADIQESSTAPVSIQLPSEEIKSPLSNVEVGTTSAETVCDSEASSGIVTQLEPTAETPADPNIEANLPATETVTATGISSEVDTFEVPVVINELFDETLSPDTKDARESSCQIDAIVVIQNSPGVLEANTEDNAIPSKAELNETNKDALSVTDTATDPRASVVSDLSMEKLPSPSIATDSAASITQQVREPDVVIQTDTSSATDETSSPANIAPPPEVSGETQSIMCRKSTASLEETKDISTNLDADISTPGSTSSATGSASATEPCTSQVFESVPQLDEVLVTDLPFTRVTAKVHKKVHFVELEASSCSIKPKPAQLFFVPKSKTTSGSGTDSSKVPEIVSNDIIPPPAQFSFDESDNVADEIPAQGGESADMTECNNNEVLEEPMVNSIESAADICVVPEILSATNTTCSDSVPPDDEMKIALGNSTSVILPDSTETTVASEITETLMEANTDPSTPVVESLPTATTDLNADTDVTANGEADVMTNVSSHSDLGSTDLSPDTAAENSHVPPTEVIESSESSTLAESKVVLLPAADQLPAALETSCPVAENSANVTITESPINVSATQPDIAEMKSSTAEVVEELPSAKVNPSETDLVSEDTTGTTELQSSELIVEKEQTDLPEEQAAAPATSSVSDENPAEATITESPANENTQSGASELESSTQEMTEELSSANVEKVQPYLADEQPIPQETSSSTVSQPEAGEMQSPTTTVTEEPPIDKVQPSETVDISEDTTGIIESIADKGQTTAQEPFSIVADGTAETTQQESPTSAISVSDRQVETAEIESSHPELTEELPTDKVDTSGSVLMSEDATGTSSPLSSENIVEKEQTDLSESYAARKTSIAMADTSGEFTEMQTNVITGLDIQSEATELQSSIPRLTEEPTAAMKNICETVHELDDATGTIGQLPSEIKAENVKTDTAQDTTFVVTITESATNTQIGSDTQPETAEMKSSISEVTETVTESDDTTGGIEPLSSEITEEQPAEQETFSIVADEIPETTRTESSTNATEPEVTELKSSIPDETQELSAAKEETCETVPGSDDTTGTNEPLSSEITEEQPVEQETLSIVVDETTETTITESSTNAKQPEVTEIRSSIPEETQESPAGKEESCETFSGSDDTNGTKEPLCSEILEEKHRTNLAEEQPAAQETFSIVADETAEATVTESSINAKQPEVTEVKSSIPEETQESPAGKEESCETVPMSTGTNEPLSSEIIDEKELTHLGEQPAAQETLSIVVDETTETMITESSINTKQPEVTEIKSAIPQETQESPAGKEESCETIPGSDDTNGTKEPLSSEITEEQPTAQETLSIVADETTETMITESSTNATQPEVTEFKYPISDETQDSPAAKKESCETVPEADEEKDLTNLAEEQPAAQETLSIVVDETTGTTITESTGNVTHVEVAEIKTLIPEGTHESPAAKKESCQIVPTGAKEPLSSDIIEEKNLQNLGEQPAVQETFSIVVDEATVSTITESSTNATQPEVTELKSPIADETQESPAAKKESCETVPEADKEKGVTNLAEEQTAAQETLSIVLDETTKTTITESSTNAKQPEITEMKSPISGEIQESPAAKKESCETVPGADDEKHLTNLAEEQPAAQESFSIVVDETTETTITESSTNATQPEVTELKSSIPKETQESPTGKEESCETVPGSDDTNGTKEPLCSEILEENHRTNLAEEQPAAQESFSIVADETAEATVTESSTNAKQPEVMEIKSSIPEETQESPAGKESCETVPMSNDTTGTNETLSSEIIKEKELTHLGEQPAAQETFSIVVDETTESTITESSGNATQLEVGEIKSLIPEETHESTAAKEESCKINPTGTKQPLSSEIIEEKDLSNLAEEQTAAQESPSIVPDETTETTRTELSTNVTQPEVSEIKSPISEETQESPATKVEPSERNSVAEDTTGTIEPCSSQIVVEKEQAELTEVHRAVQETSSAVADISAELIIKEIPINLVILSDTQTEAADIKPSTPEVVRESAASKQPCETDPAHEDQTGSIDRLSAEIAVEIKQTDLPEKSEENESADNSASSEVNSPASVIDLTATTSTNEASATSEPIMSDETIQDQQTVMKESKSSSPDALCAANSAADISQSTNVITVSETLSELASNEIEDSTDTIETLASEITVNREHTGGPSNIADDLTKTAVAESPNEVITESETHTSNPELDVATVGGSGETVLVSEAPAGIMELSSSGIAVAKDHTDLPAAQEMPAIIAQQNSTTATETQLETANVKSSVPDLNVGAAEILLLSEDSANMTDALSAEITVGTGQTDSVPNLSEDADLPAEITTPLEVVAGNSRVELISNTVEDKTATKIINEVVCTNASESQHNDLKGPTATSIFSSTEVPCTDSESPNAAQENLLNDPGDVITESSTDTTESCENVIPSTPITSIDSETKEPLSSVLAAEETSSNIAETSITEDQTVVSETQLETENAKSTTKELTEESSAAERAAQSDNSASNIDPLSPEIVVKIETTKLSEDSNAAHETSSITGENVTDATTVLGTEPEVAVITCTPKLVTKSLAAESGKVSEGLTGALNSITVDNSAETIIADAPTNIAEIQICTPKIAEESADSAPASDVTAATIHPVSCEVEKTDLTGELQNIVTETTEEPAVTPIPTSVSLLVSVNVKNETANSTEVAPSTTGTDEGAPSNESMPSRVILETHNKENKEPTVDSKSTDAPLESELIVPETTLLTEEIQPPLLECSAEFPDPPIAVTDLTPPDNNQYCAKPTEIVIDISLSKDSVSSEPETANLEQLPPETIDLVIPQVITCEDSEAYTTNFAVLKTDSNVPMATDVVPNEIPTNQTPDFDLSEKTGDASEPKAAETSTTYIEEAVPKPIADSSKIGDTDTSAVEIQCNVLQPAESESQAALTELQSVIRFKESYVDNNPELSPIAKNTNDVKEVITTGTTSSPTTDTNKPTGSSSDIATSISSTEALTATSEPQQKAGDNDLSTETSVISETSGSLQTPHQMMEPPLVNTESKTDENPNSKVSETILASETETVSTSTKVQVIAAGEVANTNESHSTEVPETDNVIAENITGVTDAATTQTKETITANSDQETPTIPAAGDTAVEVSGESIVCHTDQPDLASAKICAESTTVEPASENVNTPTESSAEICVEPIANEISVYTRAETISPSAESTTKITTESYGNISSETSAIGDVTPENKINSDESALSEALADEVNVTVETTAQILPETLTISADISAVSENSESSAGVPLKLPTTCVKIPIEHIEEKRGTSTDLATTSTGPSTMLQELPTQLELPTCEVPEEYTSESSSSLETTDSHSESTAPVTILADTDSGATSCNEVIKTPSCPKEESMTAQDLLEQQRKTNSNSVPATVSDPVLVEQTSAISSEVFRETLLTLDAPTAESTNQSTESSPLAPEPLSDITENTSAELALPLTSTSENIVDISAVHPAVEVPVASLPLDSVKLSEPTLAAHEPLNAASESCTLTSVGPSDIPDTEATTVAGPTNVEISYTVEESTTEVSAEVTTSNLPSDSNIASSEGNITVTVTSTCPPPEAHTCAVQYSTTEANITTPKNQETIPRTETVHVTSAIEDPGVSVSEPIIKQFPQAATKYDEVPPQSEIVAVTVPSTSLQLEEQVSQGSDATIVSQPISECEQTVTELYQVVKTAVDEPSSETVVISPTTDGSHVPQSVSESEPSHEPTTSTSEHPPPAAEPPLAIDITPVSEPVTNTESLQEPTTNDSEHSLETVQISPSSEIPHVASEHSCMSTERPTTDENENSIPITGLETAASQEPITVFASPPDVGEEMSSSTSTSGETKPEFTTEQALLPEFQPTAEEDPIYDEDPPIEAAIHLPTEESIPSVLEILPGSVSLAEELAAAMKENSTEIPLPTLDTQPTSKAATIKPAVTEELMVDQSAPDDQRSQTSLQNISDCKEPITECTSEITVMEASVIEPSTKVIAAGLFIDPVPAEVPNKTSEPGSQAWPTSKVAGIESTSLLNEPARSTDPVNETVPDETSAVITDPIVAEDVTEYSASQQTENKTLTEIPITVVTITTLGKSSTPVPVPNASEVIETQTEVPITVDTITTLSENSTPGPVPNVSGTESTSVLNKPEIFPEPVNQSVSTESSTPSTVANVSEEVTAIAASQQNKSKPATEMSTISPPEPDNGKDTNVQINKLQMETIEFLPKHETSIDLIVSIDDESSLLLTNQSTMVEIDSPNEVTDSDTAEGDTASGITDETTVRPLGNHSNLRKLQRQYGLEYTTPSFEDASQQQSLSTSPPPTQPRTTSTYSLAALCQKFINDKHLLAALESRRRQTLLMHKFLSTIDSFHSSDGDSVEDTDTHTEVLLHSITKKRALVVVPPASVSESCSSTTCSSSSPPITPPPVANEQSRHDHSSSDCDDCSSDSHSFKVNDRFKISYNFINKILFSDQISSNNISHTDGFSRVNTVEEIVDNDKDTNTDDEKDYIVDKLNILKSRRTTTTTSTIITSTSTSTGTGTGTCTTNNIAATFSDKRTRVSNVKDKTSSTSTHKRTNPTKITNTTTTTTTTTATTTATTTNNKDVLLTVAGTFERTKQSETCVAASNNVANGYVAKKDIGEYDYVDSDSDVSQHEELEDEDELGNLRRFVPGSIAEREYKKWYNAVEMPNNPYAPEALKRRISGSQERFIDLPNISPSTEQCPLDMITKDKLDIDESDKRESEFRRYSRDYYINDGSKSPQVINMDQDTSKDTTETTDQLEHPSTPAPPHETHTEAASETVSDLYTAIPAQVVEDTASSLDTMSQQSMQSASTTTSDDSDTIKIYNFKKQETTVIKDTKEKPNEQNTGDKEVTAAQPPLATTKERPTALSLSRTESVSGAAKVTTPTRGPTPVAFKFLQPKRKLLDPSQVLSVDEDEPQIPTGSTEKPVIEKEVVKSLPSVKALAKAFLMTSSSLQHSSTKLTWPRKAKTLPEGEKIPSKPVTLLEPTSTAEDKSEEDVTIASDLSSLETDSLSFPKQQAENTKDQTPQTSSPATTPTTATTASAVGTPGSPVPVRHGVLKSNIAFFENLKNFK